METCNEDVQKDKIKTNTMDKNLDLVNHLATADSDSFLDQSLAADMAVKQNSGNETGSACINRKEENHLVENNIPDSDKLCDLGEDMDVSDITTICSMEEPTIDSDTKKGFSTGSFSQDSFSSLQNLETFVKKDLLSSGPLINLEKDRDPSYFVQNVGSVTKENSNSLQSIGNCNTSMKDFGAIQIKHVDSNSKKDFISLQSKGNSDTDINDYDTSENKQNLDRVTKKDYISPQSTESCDTDIKDSDPSNAILNVDCNAVKDSNYLQLKENCDSNMKDSDPSGSEQIINSDTKNDSNSLQSTENCDTDMKEPNISDLMKNSEIGRKEESKSDVLTQESLLKKLGFESLNHLSLNGNTAECDVEMTAITDIFKRTEKSLNFSENETENNKTENDLKDKSSDGVLEEIKLEENIQEHRTSSPCSIINGFIEIKKDNTEGNENKDVKKVDDQKSRVNILKEELRVEEAKLLLLRKLLESQCTRKNGAPVKIKDGIHKPMNLPSLHPKQNTGRPDPSHGHYPSLSSNYTGSASHYGSVQIAPKIVLPSKSNAAGLNLPKVVPSIISAPKTLSTDTNISAVPHGARVASYVPIHNASTTVPSQPVHKYYIQVGNQLVPAAPPVNQPVYAMPAYTTAVAQPKVMAVQTTQANIKPPPISTAESQASKHSAAKAALRRQLEQTLLQIPPPRPPPADWNAVPNVNSIDFMMLVGLDEVVDMVLDIGGKPTLKQLLADFMPKSPSICRQCDVDFSPAWKTKTNNSDKGENKTLCEKCSMMNVKKELKSEHTSRLKAAFLKALKQEQEIEEKIKAGEDVIIASLPPSDKDHSGQQQVVQHHPQQAGHVHQLHQPHQHQTHSGQVDHHHQAYRHHHHQIVQHYPHHNSLVHQLHQQHMQQQQQVEYDKNGRRTSSSNSSSPRWHPYMPSQQQQHHHSSHVHNPQHHRTGRTYVSTTDGRQEYYVVHHPQHSTSGQHTSVRWTH